MIRQTPDGEMRLCVPLIANLLTYETTEVII